MSPDTLESLAERFTDCLCKQCLDEMAVGRTPETEPQIEIRSGNIAGEEIEALVALHLQGMHEITPPGHVFSLELVELNKPDVTVWSAWCAGRLAGMAALRMLDERSAEVKSMRTHPDHLRRGVAQALLEHIVTEAQRRNVKRLSLETGRGPGFEPAISLYMKFGFRPGAAFAPYKPDPFSQFLHLKLDESV